MTERGVSHRLLFLGGPSSSSSDIGTTTTTTTSTTIKHLCRCRFQIDGATDRRTVGWSVGRSDERTDARTNRPTDQPLEEKYLTRKGEYASGAPPFRGFLVSLKFSFPLPRSLRSANYPDKRGRLREPSSSNDSASDSRN